MAAAMRQRNRVESVFQGTVIELAERMGWTVYHTWLSIHSAKGYPDLTIAREGRLIFAELKKPGEQATPEQAEWLALLATTPGVETFLWHPADWPEIVNILTEGRGIPQ